MSCRLPVTLLRAVSVWQLLAALVAFCCLSWTALILQPAHRAQLPSILPAEQNSDLQLPAVKWSAVQRLLTQENHQESRAEKLLAQRLLTQENNQESRAEKLLAQHLLTQENNQKPPAPKWLAQYLPSQQNSEQQLPTQKLSAVYLPTQQSSARNLSAQRQPAQQNYDKNPPAQKMPAEPLPSQQPQVVNSSESSAGTVSQTVRVPLSALHEPALPSGGWFPASDPVCGRYRTSFVRAGSLPDTWIVSYFRSGNTWTRFLLEVASGVATCGDKWNNDAASSPGQQQQPAAAELARLLQKRRAPVKKETPGMHVVGFIGDDLPGEARVCLARKGHGFPPPWRKTSGDGRGDREGDDRDDGGGDGSRRDVAGGVGGGRGGVGGDDGMGGNGTGVDGSSGGNQYPVSAILLIRDPFRAIISYQHLLENNSALIDRSEASRREFEGPDWADFVARNVQLWFLLPERWATHPADTLVVPYELLQRQSKTQLKAMLDFLGISPEPGRLHCALFHAEDTPFRNRRHPVVPDKTVFDLATRTLVWDHIHRLHALLQSRGYPGLPLENYAFADEFNVVQNATGGAMVDGK